MKSILDRNSDVFRIKYKLKCQQAFSKLLRWNDVKTLYTRSIDIFARRKADTEIKNAVDIVWIIHQINEHFDIFIVPFLALLKLIKSFMKNTFQ